MVKNRKLQKSQEPLVDSPSRLRSGTIVAHDPSIRVNGKILTAEVEFPAEELAPGPWGYRVHVVDYDATTDRLFTPRGWCGKDAKRTRALPVLFSGGVSQTTILEDPTFHACNAYIIAMRTLGRFERALGRRVSWGFYGHQLKLAPHAFEDANVFYSHDDQALLLGYFPGKRGPIFTCLSHDIIAQECTHALVDGIRVRYNDPSSPDQAAFHEGFSDVVAILSVFALPEVVRAALGSGRRGLTAHKATGRIAANDVSPSALRASALLGLADQLGEELSMIRGRALRRSADLVPRKDYLQRREFQEPHRRGEILVAAVINAFLEVWAGQIKTLGTQGAADYDLQRVISDGAEAADHLLTTCIRALDYCPPVHLEFGDFLSAILTADTELHPEDRKYGYRRRLLASFTSYGITPSSNHHSGIWAKPGERGEPDLRYNRIHAESLTRDRDECFRFVFENRDALQLADGAYTRVLSLRPCVRVDFDGFILRETVAEVMQIAKLRPPELRDIGIQVPRDIPVDTEIDLYGGCTLVFDESGRLKFNIHNRLENRERQSARIKHLHRAGFLSGRATGFDALHRARTRDTIDLVEEAWT